MEFSIGTALQAIRLLAPEWSHVVNQSQIFGVNTGFWDTRTHCLTSAHLFHLIDVWGAQSRDKTWNYSKKEKSSTHLWWIFSEQFVKSRIWMESDILNLLQTLMENIRIEHFAGTSHTIKGTGIILKVCKGHQQDGKWSKLINICTI